MNANTKKLSKAFLLAEQEEWSAHLSHLPGLNGKNLQSVHVFALGSAGHCKKEMFNAVSASLC